MCVGVEALVVRLLRMTDGACVLSSFRPSARQTASTVNVRRALRLPPSSDKWPRLPHVPGDAAAAVLVAENSCLRARRTAHVASHTRVGFRSKLTALSKSDFVENYCPNSASGRRVVQLDWIADSIKPKTLITVVCSHSTKTLILSLRPICWIAMHMTGSLTALTSLFGQKSVQNGSRTVKTRIIFLFCAVCTIIDAAGIICWAESV